MTTRERPRVAILPVYLELYDRSVPDLLPRQMGFLSCAQAALGSVGVEAVTLPVCRTLAQTTHAVAEAEKQGAHGIVCLHLAYAPSLEIAPALVDSRLPLLLWDTTPRPSFGPGAAVNDVLENHGIHGVQDLASVLLREQRTFDVIAGPLGDEEASARIALWARAAQARHLLHHLQVARIGDAFPGMGDFSVEDEVLRKVVGPTVMVLDIPRIADRTAKVTDADIAAEREADRAAFDCFPCPEVCWDRSNRVGLGLRRALAEIGAEAFSFNFASFDRSLGTPAVPFLEASKAMARGLGYAGEGDVLTASLVAALDRCYGPTTFTEMFCPDWQGGRVFMSHMGECNPALAQGRPQLVEKDYAYGPADNPAVLVFPLKPGPAALVNLAPGPHESMTLIAADVEIDATGLEPGLPAMPHFWIIPPSRDLPRFLERYSEAGGTHHLALTPGIRAADLAPLAHVNGWRFAALAQQR